MGVGDVVQGPSLDVQVTSVGVDAVAEIDIDAGTGLLSLDSATGSITMGATLTDSQTLKLGKNGATEMIFTPHGTPANEKISLTNTAGTAADAISLTSTAGGITLLASGNDSSFRVQDAGKDLDLEVSGGSTQELRIVSAGTGTNAIQLNTSAGGITLDAHTDIILDANGGDVFLKDNTTTFGSLTNNSGNLIIKSGTTTATTFTGANVAFAGSMIIDYGSLATSDPSVAGKLYKNGSNQVFISAGGGM
jgi:hypothetical protein